MVSEGVGREHEPPKRPTDRYTSDLGDATFRLSEVTTYRVLDADGTMRPGAADAAVDDEVAIALLRRMILSRACDDWCIRLQRMGRIRLYGPLHGQEASAVGTAAALDPSIDWLVPAYREQAAWLQHGLPLDSLLAIYMGKLDVARVPENVNMLPRQQSVGAQLPHAVGLAWALKHRRTGGIVMSYCGDGASSEGDFHEACNLGGVLQAPVIFVVQNNAWAISTPVSSQTATLSIAARAPGFGFPGYRVDGNDVLAVYHVARLAVARARAGDGPTLIENVTYRMGFHNTTDNPKRYRDDAEVQSAALADPIARLERHLMARGVLTQELANSLRAEADRELAAAVERVTSHPAPAWSDAFEHVYADPPARQIRQRRRLAQELGEAP